MSDAALVGSLRRMFEALDPLLTEKLRRQWAAKPGTACDGETTAIDTAVPGITIANGWDKTARVLNDIALVRSMTNKEGNHQRATYQLHTGYAPTGTVKHPHLGCAAANELGDPKFDLPHLVSIGGPTIGTGILGVALEPFVVPAVNRPRFARRLDLLHALEHSGFERTGGADRVKDHTATYRQTMGLVLSPRMQAFDLAGEDPKVRAAYRTSAFGQGCLLARRLVQAGETFVEVRSKGWDHHEQIKERIGMLSGEVDPAFAALISDLKGRGMLDKTLVVWMGEFGRTPKINPRAGRDHFPRVFSVALVGGGIKGGQVLGASSGDGTEVKDRPVAVPDLMASLCHALTIDPTKENMSPLRRPIKIVEGGKVVKELFA